MIAAALNVSVEQRADGEQEIECHDEDELLGMMVVLVVNNKQGSRAQSGNGQEGQQRRSFGLSAHFVIGHSHEQGDKNEGDASKFQNKPQAARQDKKNRHACHVAMPRKPFR